MFMGMNTPMNILLKRVFSKMFRVLDKIENLFSKIFFNSPRTLNFFQETDRGKNVQPNVHALEHFVQKSLQVFLGGCFCGGLWGFVGIVGIAGVCGDLWGFQTPVFFFILILKTKKIQCQKKSR